MPYNIQLVTLSEVEESHKKLYKVATILSS